MASIRKNKSNGQFLIVFRFAGRQFQRSLKTQKQQEALAVCVRVEDTIRLIQQGRIEIPTGVDVAEFILSDGRMAKPLSVEQPIKLKELFVSYRLSLPVGAKEKNTVDGEEIHIAHLLRHLGTSRLVQSLTPSEIQEYIGKRLDDCYRGRPISVETIKKELSTFRLIWNWALTDGRLSQSCPMRGLKFPKSDEKPPFMTRVEIERRIGRSRDDAVLENSLWECLFLSRAEVEEVLDEVKKIARHPFVYPMFAFVAHTGARRSELLRSEVDDFDFESRMVRIREKKRSRKKATTFRHVPMSQRLRVTMQAWFAQHPGGKYTLTQGLHRSRKKQRTEIEPLTASEATNHFKHTLKDSVWNIVRGFHVFRHSFASNAAAADIDQRIIDEWMGHQTEEMRRRYRHLFPQQQHTAMDRLFSRATG